MVVPKVKFRVVWAALERSGKTHWTKIGLAWEGRTGALFVRLDALPLTGRLCIKDETMAAQGAAAQAGGTSR